MSDPSTGSSGFAIWTAPGQYAGDNAHSRHVSKANVFTGKQHRNRLRDAAVHLSSEMIEWTRVIVRKNIIADDCFQAFANGELLCIIINTVCPSDSLITISPGCAIKSPESRAHVGAFLRACTRLGVAQHHLFKPKDLVKRNNDRRVMRTLLYFVLALMKFGVLPIPSLIPRVQTLCNATGYALPEVIFQGRSLMGRFGAHYVRPATAGVTSPSSSAPKPFNAARRSWENKPNVEPMDEKRERERREREENAKEFRPQLQFIGGGNKKKKPLLTTTRMNNLTSDPNAANLSPNKDGDQYSRDPRFDFDRNERKSNNNYDSPAGRRNNNETPPISPVAPKILNDGLSNIGLLAQDADGHPLPSFPHTAGDRFEAALQNLDLSDLLQSEADETDIDKPLVAALLFPAFHEAQGEMLPGQKHGAWNRTGADLHVRVDPIKYAMWISRHPFKALATVLAAWVIAIIVLFGPYPRPFIVDLSTTSYHAKGDVYLGYENAFKSAVQNSWEYAKVSTSQLNLYAYKDDVKNKQNTFHTEENSPHASASANVKRQFRVMSRGTSPRPDSTMTDLVFDLLKHHSAVNDAIREQEKAEGTFDTSVRPVVHPDADTRVEGMFESFKDDVSRQLLQAAAGKFDYNAQWKSRARAKTAARAKAQEEYAASNGEFSSSSSSPASRDTLSFNTDYTRNSQLATTMTLIYISNDGNMLDDRHLNYVRYFEKWIGAQDAFKRFCLLNASPSTALQTSASSDVSGLTARYTNCEFPDTAINYYAARLDPQLGILYMDGANSTSLNNITTVTTLLQNWERTGFFDRYFTPSVLDTGSYGKSTHMRSDFSFGVPLPDFVDDGVSTADWDSDQEIQWTQTMVLDNYIGAVASQTLGDSSITMAIDGPGVQLRILKNIIFNHDIKLIIGAVFAVIAYAVLHIRSLYIVTGSMVQIIISFFITAFWYRVVFRFDTLNILHVICLFVVLALGINDAFVVWDTFWHSSLLRLKVELPFDRAARKKAQEELAYKRRQEDPTCNGAFMRFWYDHSGGYDAWRCIKRHIPCFTVTDYDLTQHFETGVQHSNPLGPIAGRTDIRGSGAMSSFLDGGAGVPNPLVASSQRPNAAGRRRHKRDPSGISVSDTPTRLEKDSDGEDIAPGQGSILKSNMDPSAPGIPGKPKGPHRRFGSQDSNPMNELSLDASHDKVNSPDDQAEEVSFPVPRGPNSNPLVSGAGGGHDRRFSKTAEAMIHIDKDGNELPPMQRAPSSGGFFGAPVNNRGDNTSGGNNAAANEAERARTAAVMAALERMDGPEMEDEDEAAALEGMASRSGGLKSAIIRKTADRLALRMSWTYRRAVPSMIVTNLTIIIALYAIAVSSIGPIKGFGVFMGSVALVNFALSLTFLPTLIITQYLWFRRFSILPRGCWNRIKGVTRAVDTKLNEGDVKYDDALLEDTDEEEDAARAEGRANDTSKSSRSKASTDPTHTHKSSGGASPNAPSPREMDAKKVTVRANKANPDFDQSMEDLPAEALPENGEGVRGGVNFTKGEPPEVRPPVANRDGLIHPQDPNDKANLMDQEPKKPDGLLVKKKLNANLDAERSKANKNLEKSRRNQLLLFLNATIFRFRFYLLVMWVGIFILCIIQAVKLKVPQQIITVLPPDSNLELLKNAYAQLPSCQGCTYEFDRVEHQVIPFETGLPITTDLSSATDTDLQGGPAAISIQSMKPSPEDLHLMAKKPAFHIEDYDAETIASIKVAPPEEGTVHSSADIVHPVDLEPIHMSGAHNVWQSESQPKSPLQTSSNFVRAYRALKAKHDSTQLDATVSGEDYLTGALGVPSPPPLLYIGSDYVGYNTVKFLFAQSLFAGLKPVLSYTMVITPIRATNLPSASNVFQSGQPACVSGGATQVTKMVVKVRPKLAQSDLSPLSACIQTSNSTTSCSSSASVPGVPPVVLGSDWFSTGTLVGGQYTPGVTYTASGGVVNDLSGFVHNTQYSVSMYASNVLGDSVPTSQATFQTLDATPPAPTIMSVSVGLDSAQAMDAQSDLNPQFDVNITVRVKYMDAGGTPAPTLLTIYWNADPTTIGTFHNNALPGDGQTQSYVMDVSGGRGQCQNQPYCDIIVPTIQTTQIRGGYPLFFVVRSSNDQAQGPASAPVSVSSVPEAPPFAPVIIGYVSGDQLPNNIFASPTVRLYFQVASMNKGPTRLNPTAMVLLYKQNAGLIHESDMIVSPDLDWTYQVKLADSSLPIQTLSPVLPLSQSPIYQVDFSDPSGSTLLPNRVYQFRMKSKMPDTGTGFLRYSTASNALLVATPTAPVLPPIITALNYASGSQTLTVTYSPPTPNKLDPIPSLKFWVLITSANPPVGGSSETFGSTTAQASASSPQQLPSIAANSLYYLSMYMETPYARSPNAAIICFTTSAGSHPLSATLSVCPTVNSNQLCFSNYDGSQKTCDPKTQLRTPPVDQVMIWESPPASSPSRKSFVATRRFKVTNKRGAQSLYLDSVTTTPVQTLSSFRSPLNNSIACLDGGYDIWGKINAACYVPCLSDHCNSLCGHLTFGVQNNGQTVGSMATRTDPYGGALTSVGANIDNTMNPDFVIQVSPDFDAAPGLYSCGFNFKAVTVDQYGGVISSLGPRQPGVEVEVQSPFDVIISVRVLPLTQPTAVRNVGYGFVTATSPDGVSQQARNITFAIPYAPPTAPICMFELNYYNPSTPDQRTKLFLPSPTAAEGLTLSTLLFGSGKDTIRFSVRAWNMNGAQDFESEVLTSDCSLQVQSTQALADCNNLGSCFTPNYLFPSITKGTNSTDTTLYAVLSNEMNHDVADTSDKYTLGSYGCQCFSGSYGNSCLNSCPSGLPANTTGKTTDLECFGQGNCDPNLHACTCYFGYGGTACQTQCPNSCFGRGTCTLNPITGAASCTCYGGYGGPDCGSTCPVNPVSLQSCNGVGTCDGNVNCVCNVQYHGKSCGVQCPGSYQTSNGTLEVCNGRGACVADDETLENPSVQCVCDDHSDTTGDCSRTLSGIAAVHYELPPAPALPSFVFPTIHLVWGVRGFNPSTNIGGVSSATDTGADGTRSVSAASSQSAGTAYWDPRFDITDPDSQRYLMDVCDVMYRSGLINEAASQCLISQFAAYQKVRTNPNAFGSFPVFISTFSRSMISFLGSLTGNARLFRQHVGFLFSTSRFVAYSATQSARSRTIHEYAQMFKKDNEDVHMQSTNGEWFNSFSKFTSQSKTFDYTTVNAKADAEAADAETSVFLNIDQIEYLMNHPDHEDKFHIILQGEEETYANEFHKRTGRRLDTTTAATYYVRICFIALEFIGTFDTTDTTAAFQKQFAAAWDDVTVNHLNPVAPNTMSNCFHASETWVAMSQQLAFAQGISRGFAIMFVFIFVFVMLFTGWNLKLAFLIIVNILCIVCILFAILVSFSGNLGVIEYIASQIVIALSVHYLLYIGHAYIISPFNTRFGRTRHGLLEWGASVFSSGASMTISSFVLNFATINVLSVFGQILCVMTIVIMLFTLTFYVPMLQCIGPMGYDPKAAEKAAKAAEQEKERKVLEVPRSPEFAAPPSEKEEAEERARERAARAERRARRGGPEELAGVPIGEDGFRTGPPPDREGGVGVGIGAGLRGGGGFGRFNNGEIPETGLLDAMEMVPTRTNKDKNTPSTPELDAKNTSGPPGRHERKPAGNAPIPHPAPLRKTSSGNLQLSSSEDEDDDDYMKPPAPVKKNSDADDKGKKSKASEPGEPGSKRGSFEKDTALSVSEERKEQAAPVPAPKPSLPEVKRGKSRMDLPPIDASPTAPLASPSAPLLSSTPPVQSPSGLASPSAPSSDVAFVAAATGSASAKRKKKSSRPPSLADPTGAGAPGLSSASVLSSASTIGESHYTRGVPFREQPPMDAPAVAAAGENWDDEVIVDEQQLPKKSKKHTKTKSRSFEPEEIVEIEHEDDQPAPKAPSRPARPPVVVHTASSSSSSKPAARVPASFPAPAASSSSSTIVEADANEWDKDLDEPLPTRMGRQPSLGKAPLPPMALSRPMSQGLAPLPLSSPVGKPSLSSLSPASPPSGSGFSAGFNKAPLKSTKPLPPRVLPSTLPKKQAEEDDLDLDISHDEDVAPTRGGAPTRSKKSPQLDESVEIEHSWDE